MKRVISRMDYLRNTKTKIKFLSLEPLLGSLPGLNLENIGWVIVGGESGFKARPIKKEWIVEIKDQCKKLKIPFFFKQWGKPEFNIDKNDPTINSKHKNHAKGGCLLNGKMYRELPKVKRFTPMFAEPSNYRASNISMN